MRTKRILPANPRPRLTPRRRGSPHAAVTSAGLALALALALTALGCGGADKPAAHARESSLIVIPDLQCSDASLSTGAHGACLGPWKYSKLAANCKTANQAQRNCGFTAAYNYQTCANQAFGFVPGGELNVYRSIDDEKPLEDAYKNDPTYYKWTVGTADTFVCNEILPPRVIPGTSQMCTHWKPCLDQSSCAHRSDVYLIGSTYYDCKDPQCRAGVGPDIFPFSLYCEHVGEELAHEPAHVKVAYPVPGGKGITYWPPVVSTRGVAADTNEFPNKFTPNTYPNRVGYCEVTLNDLVPRTATGAVCGVKNVRSETPNTCVLPNPGACGPEKVQKSGSTITPVYLSGYNLDLDGLRAEAGFELRTVADAYDTPINAYKFDYGNHQDTDHPASLLDESSIQCLTGDQNPIDSPGAILTQAKLLHYQIEHLPPGLAFPGSYIALIVVKLKIMLALHADAFTGTDGLAERRFIESLYQQYDSYHTRCEGEGFSPPSVGDACTVPDGLDGRLDMCQRMLGSNVPVASVAALASDCAAAIADVGQMAAGGDCRDAYRAAYIDQMSSIMKALIGNDVPTKSDNLRTALAFFHAWYTQEAAALGTDAQSPLWADLSTMEQVFWSATHASGVKNLKLPTKVDNVDKDAENIIKALGDADLNDSLSDLAVLQAAFTTTDGQIPLRSAPLLVVMHDVLFSLANRTRDAAAFHDFACHYKNVTANGYQDACALVKKPSEITALTDLLGSFANPGTAGDPFDGAIARAKVRFKNAKVDWSGAFDSLKTNHKAFETVVLGVVDPEVLKLIRPDGTYDPSLVTDPRLAAVTPALVDLGRLATEFSARSTGYDKTGLFDPSLTNRLARGIQVEEYQSFVNDLAIDSGSLKAALGDYSTKLRQTVNDLLGVLQGNGKDFDASAQLEAKSLQYHTLSGQLAALQAAQADEDSAFGKQLAQFARDFGDLKDSGVVDASGALIDVHSKHFYADLSELDAKYAPGRKDLTTFAVRAFSGQDGDVWKMNVAPGSVMTIQSDGKWSPTCALSAEFDTKNTDLPINDAPVDLKSFPGALTSTEGFTMQKTDSGYALATQTHSESSTDTIDVGVEAKACAGMGLAKAFSPTTVEVCAHFGYDHSWAKSDTTTSGQQREAITSASFTSGLHTKFSPFPSMTAGSLLLVTMKAGGSKFSDVIDVRPVLGGANTFVVKGVPGDRHNVDLYLVVNDMSCGDKAPPPKSTVHVDTKLFVALESRLPYLMNAMSQALDWLGQQRDSLVAQGRILPETRGLLRSTAFAFLTSQKDDNGNGIDLSQYPAPFQQLFNHWLDRQMARLERAVEISNLSDQCKLLEIDLKALTVDSKTAGAQARIQQLLPAWALQDIQGDTVRVSADAVTHRLNDFYPILMLRYPNLLSAIRNNHDIQDSLDRLLDTSTSSGFVAMAGEMWSAANIIYNIVHNTPQPRSPLSPVVLQFPKSDRIKQLFPKCGITATGTFVGDGGGPAGSASMTAGANGTVFRYHQVSQDRADALWYAICTAGLGTLQLGPEDVYDDGSIPGQGAATLDCHDGSPIMRAMAVVLTVRDSTVANDINRFPFAALLGISSHLLFPTPRGVMTYHIDDRSWLPSKLPIVGAVLGDEVTNFQNNRNLVSAGDGLSPFNTYQVNLKALAGAANSPLATASAINLVFQADSANVVDKITQVNACINAQ